MRVTTRVKHWHVWLAAEPAPGRAVTMLRRINRAFGSVQAASQWAARRERESWRWLVRRCEDPRCRFRG